MALLCASLTCGSVIGIDQNCLRSAYCSDRCSPCHLIESTTKFNQMISIKWNSFKPCFPLACLPCTGTVPVGHSSAWVFSPLLVDCWSNCEGTLVTSVTGSHETMLSEGQHCLFETPKDFSHNYYQGALRAWSKKRIYFLYHLTVQPPSPTPSCSSMWPKYHDRLCKLLGSHVPNPRPGQMKATVMKVKNPQVSD